MKSKEQSLFMFRATFLFICNWCWNMKSHFVQTNSFLCVCSQSCPSLSTSVLRMPRGWPSMWCQVVAALPVHNPSESPKSPNQSLRLWLTTTSLFSCCPRIRRTSFWWVWMKISQSSHFNNVPGYLCGISPPFHCIIACLIIVCGM